MKNFYVFLVSALFLLPTVQAVETDYRQGLSIWFDTPNSLTGQAVWLRSNGNRGANLDREWESRSLPIGNGSLGANILGSVAAERITLNEKTLWRGGPNTSGGADYYWNVNKQSAPILKEIRQAFTEGNGEKAAQLTRKNFNGLAAYEEKDEHPFRFGSFTTMGELYIETGLSELRMKNYRRILSLDSAMAVVQFDKEGVQYRRKYFISYPDSVMAMEFSADKAGKQNLVLSYAPNPELTTQSMMNQALLKGYETLANNHKADYTALFNRVKLTLNPDVTGSDLPTYQRLANYRKGQPDFRLEELYYQFGRYLLIASSRPGNLPANLQGMWHNNLDGPWRVDYHNNINIQMNYWPAGPTNLSECTWPLIDFIRGLVKPGEKTAQAYFAARGWTASISANIFGFTSPLSSEIMAWNFNPMAGPWLATHIWEYYDYTRDRNFLKEVGYDLIKSSAQFTVDYLWHKPDGTYTAAPSTSPEHGPVDEGATFVHAVVREILLDAIEASKVLGVDSRERKHWQEVLAHLVPYKIGRYGQLLEWSKDIDDPNDKHRHVNHLFGLHPGRTLSPVTTPELAKAARIVLEHRGDGATGWSMGWKLNQWARLQDGNHAYTLFGNLLKNGTLDNLWDTHAPFQIDGNFGGTAGVTEMLLQSHMGFIQLLPALPDAWKDGVVSGLCAKGNFEVSISWKNNRLDEAILVSKAGAPCTVRYEDKTLSFKTVKGKTYKVKVDGDKLTQIQ